VHPRGPAARHSARPAELWVTQVFPRLEAFDRNWIALSVDYHGQDHSLSLLDTLDHGGHCHAEALRLPVHLHSEHAAQRHAHFSGGWRRRSAPQGLAQRRRAGEVRAGAALLLARPSVPLAELAATEPTREIAEVRRELVPSVPGWGTAYWQ